MAFSLTRSASVKARIKDGCEVENRWEEEREGNLALWNSWAISQERVIVIILKGR